MVFYRVGFFLWGMLICAFPVIIPVIHDSPSGITVQHQCKKFSINSSKVNTISIIVCKTSAGF